MGFFDAIKKGAEIAKKGAEIAKKGIEMADEAAKKNASRMSDGEISSALDKNPNNRYAQTEANKRGI